MSILWLGNSFVKALVLASVDSSGIIGNSSSKNASFSADGRYVAFWSFADNLVPADTNDRSDVFVHDRRTGNTERVSVDSSSNEGDGNSQNASISADGRYVAFESFANNLESPGNGRLDVFVHDRQTGDTEKISVDSSGNPANITSHRASISADGRYIAFQSSGNNLVEGATNLADDVFVRDRQEGTTTRVSVKSSGAQGAGGSTRPEISANGRYVAFVSGARLAPGGSPGGLESVYVHDQQTGRTRLVSVDSEGNSGNGNSREPNISPTGRYVAFSSDAFNLVPGDVNAANDIFVHDRKTGITERVSLNSWGDAADNHSFLPSISGNGRFVSFESQAQNLAVGEEDSNDQLDVFVHDRWTGQTERLSKDSFGNEAVSPS